MGKIDIKNCKGLYDIVSDDKKEFSPFNGLIWIETDLIEKYYRFGFAKVNSIENKKQQTFEVFVSGDAVIELVRKLFKIEGGFSARAEPTHASSLLSPKIIGQILNLIDKTDFEFKEKIENHLKEIENKLLDSYLEALKAWTLSKETKEKLEFTSKNLSDQEKKLLELAKVQNTLGQLRKLAINTSEFDKKINDVKNLLKWALIEKEKEQVKENFISDIAKIINTKLKQKIELKEIEKTVIITADNNEKTNIELLEKDILKLAKIIVNALDESAYFTDDPSKQKYVKNIAHSFLLSFLYLTIKSKGDLKDYFDQFQPSIIKKTIENIDPWASAFTNEDIPKNLMEVNSIKDSDTLISDTFESHCYTEIYDNKFGGKSSPALGFEEVTLSYNGNKLTAFMNCTEINIFNLIRLFLSILGLYDSEKKVFLMDQLENVLAKKAKEKNVSFDKEKLKPLIDFFSSINNDACIIVGPKIHVPWTMLVSNIPGVKYLRYYDIKRNQNEKDREHPSMHTEMEKDGVIPIHATKQEDYYLSELSGYPSTYLNVIKHLLGLAFDSLEQMFLFFDIVKVDASNLAKFTDDATYNYGFNNKNKSLEPTWLLLKFTLDDKAQIITIQATPGHSELELPTENRTDKTLYHKNYFFPKKWLDFRYQNLTSCFSHLSEAQLNEAVSILGPAEKLHLFFIISTLNPKELNATVTALCFAITENLTQKINTEKLFTNLINSKKNKLLLPIIKSFGKNTENKKTLNEYIVKVFNAIDLNAKKLSADDRHIFAQIILDKKLTPLTNLAIAALIAACNKEYEAIEAKKISYVFHFPYNNYLKQSLEHQKQMLVLLNFAPQKFSNEQIGALIKLTTIALFDPFMLMFSSTYEPEQKINQEPIKALFENSTAIMKKLFDDTTFFLEWMKKNGIKTENNQFITSLPDYVLYRIKTITLDIIEYLSDQQLAIFKNWITTNKETWIDILKKMITNFMPNESENLKTTFNTIENKFKEATKINILEKKKKRKINRPLLF